MRTTDVSVAVQISAGDAAFLRLDDKEFIEAWKRLHATCAWATAFQSFDFVDTWYRLFDSIYEPIIVEGRDSDGGLVGLLTLARRRPGSLLVGAGDIHAEYQTWVAAEPAVKPFLVGALDALERAFPRGRLFFNYLSRGTPLAWLDGVDRWPPRVHIKPRAGGLIDLSDPTPIEASLRKGHNRSRLNSLRRFGDVGLETIDSVEDLESMIDEIAVLCDLRQGAVNDSLPFASSPLKQPLHLELMKRGLLHATVLRVGSRLASAHLDMKNGDEVLIYLIAHSPVFARYSPGSLHILMLASELAGQGIRRYDLSPGGGYKDRFANTHEPIQRMSVQFGFAERVVADASNRAVRAASGILAVAGHTPRSAQLEAGRLRARLTKPQARQPARPTASDERVFRLPQHPAEITTERLALDRLQDLLAYAPGGNGPPTLRHFLRLAIYRLEAGHRVLTRMDGPELAECWWVIRLDRAPKGATISDPADISMASALLIFDPTLSSSAAGPEREAALPRLMATVRELAPRAGLFLALAEGDDALVERVIAAGAAPVDPALEPVPEELLPALAKGWPADRPDPD